MTGMLSYGRIAVAARGAARVREDDRLFARHAMDDDVEKTADDRAESGDESAGERQREARAVASGVTRSVKNVHAMWMLDRRLSSNAAPLDACRAL